MPTVIITGANRGLGLEFARQYSSEGWKVYACCRTPDKAEELQKLEVSVCRLDLVDSGAIDRFAKSLHAETIDLLINNAGLNDVSKSEGFSGIEEARWLDAFKVNVMAPVLLTIALMENLAASKHPVASVIGSQQGCLETYEGGGYYLYRTTKAATHAAAVILATDLKEKNIPYVCLRPGHTKTDMGGKDAPYEIEDSVRLMRDVLAHATMEHTGQFVDRSGALIPWSLNKDLNE